MARRLVTLVIPPLVACVALAGCVNGGVGDGVDAEPGLRCRADSRSSAVLFTDDAHLTTVGPGRDDVRLGRRGGEGELPTPTREQLLEMRVDAARLCRFRNPSSGVPKIDQHFTLTHELVLSAYDIATLIESVGAAASESPSCSMIDSPPPVTYVLLLQDEQGHTWRVAVPEEPCLGFRLAGGREYQSDVVPRMLLQLVKRARS